MRVSTRSSDEPSTMFSGLRSSSLARLPFQLGLGRDISSPLPLSPNDDDDVAAQDKSNEIRIGPMTRARAKLLGQQVNSLLIESDILIDENFILPKSMHLCMIRFVDNTSVARGEGDLQQEEQALISSKCAREEREADALGDNEEITYDQERDEEHPEIHV
uniref:Uncharacterized protein n=1 Tax=Avena sativa TaxID=4498 RepID=A0ACD5U7U5_AVESA